MVKEENLYEKSHHFCNSDAGCMEITHFCFILHLMLIILNELLLDNDEKYLPITPDIIRIKGSYCTIPSAAALTSSLQY